MHSFQGIWTALWSPTDQNGRIIDSAVKTHVEFLRQAGIQGLVVCGSTGECTRLSPQRRQELLHCVMKHRGTLPVFLNISDPVRDHVKMLVQTAKEFQVDGVMILPPSYYYVSQSDILAYFLDIYTMTQEIPFFLYNYPECVRNTIDIDTIRRLTERMPLAGIKPSGSHFEYHIDLIKLAKEKKFSVLTGADSRLPEALKLGVDGSIGGLSNAIPELILEVYRLAKNGQDTSGPQSKIEALVNLASSDSFPYNVSALMTARGFEVGSPKIARSAESLALHAKVVHSLKEMLPSNK